MRSLLAGYPAAALCYQITLVTNSSMDRLRKGCMPACNGKLVLDRYCLIDRNSCS